MCMQLLLLYDNGTLIIALKQIHKITQPHWLASRTTSVLHICTYGPGWLMVMYVSYKFLYHYASPFSQIVSCSRVSLCMSGFHPYVSRAFSMIRACWAIESGMYRLQISSIECRILFA